MKTEPRAGFAWADHACRFCGFRLAERPGQHGGKAFECGNCGASCAGPTPHRICGCGADIGHRRAATGARFRCASNPAPSPQNPSLVVIVYGVPE